MFPIKTIRQTPVDHTADIPNTFDRSPVAIAILNEHPIKKVRPSDGTTVPRITFSISQGENSVVYCLYGNGLTSTQVGSPLGHRYFPTGKSPHDYMQIRKPLRSYDSKAVQALISALRGTAGRGTRLSYSDGFKRHCLDHEQNRQDLFDFLTNAHDHIAGMGKINGTNIRSTLHAARTRLQPLLGRSIGSRSH